MIDEEIRQTNALEANSEKIGLLYFPIFQTLK